MNLEKVRPRHFFTKFKGFALAKLEPRLLVYVDKVDSFILSLPRADLWINSGSDDGPDPVRIGVPIISFSAKDDFRVAVPVPFRVSKNGWKSLSVKPGDDSPFFLQIREDGKIKKLTVKRFQKILAEKSGTER